MSFTGVIKERFLKLEKIKYILYFYIFKKEKKKPIDMPRGWYVSSKTNWRAIYTTTFLFFYV